MKDLRAPMMTKSPPLPTQQQQHNLAPLTRAPATQSPPPPPQQQQHNLAPRLLTRGVDVVQAYTNMQGSHQDVSGSSSPQILDRRSKSPLLASRFNSQESCDRSRSPINVNGNGSSNGMGSPR